MEGFYKGSKRDLLKGSVRVKGIYGGFCKSQKGCTREAEGFRKASTRIKKKYQTGSTRVLLPVGRVHDSVRVLQGSCNGSIRGL